jgi:hypothetical protein
VIMLTGGVAYDKDRGQNGICFRAVWRGGWEVFSALVVGNFLPSPKKRPTRQISILTLKTKDASRMEILCLFPPCPLYEGYGT